MVHSLPSGINETEDVRESHSLHVVGLDDYSFLFNAIKRISESVHRILESMESQRDSEEQCSLVAVGPRGSGSLQQVLAELLVRSIPRVTNEH